MTCTTLKRLVELFRKHDVDTHDSEIVRVVCHHCERAEVCPAISDAEYDASRDGQFPTTIELVVPGRFPASLTAN